MSTTRPETPRAIGAAGWALLLVVVGVGALAGASSAWTRGLGEPGAWPESDFQILWAAGQGLQQGADIHDPLVLDAFGRAAGRSPTPFCAALPLVARAVAVVSGDDFMGAYRRWLRVNGVLLALCVGLLAADLVREGLGARLAICLALVVLTLNDATWMSLYFNQLNLAVLAAVLGALAAARSGRARLEGVLLGLGMVLKIWPVLLVLGAAAAGRWRTVATAAGTLVLLLLASIAWNGVEVHSSYAALVLPALSYAPSQDPGAFQNSLHAWNLAPNGFLTRALGPGAAAAILAWVLTLAVVALLLLTVRRDRDDILTRYACGMAAALVVSSVTWPHHLVWAALPVAWLAARAWRAPRGGLGRSDALAALVCAVLFLPLGSLGGVGLDVAAKGLACLGLFLLLALPALRAP